MTKKPEPEHELELSEAVRSFAPLFGQPVAVQLKTPLLQIEAQMDVGPDGTLPKNEDGDDVIRYVTSGGLGWPELAMKRDPKGNPLSDPSGAPLHRIDVVLLGSLRPSPCGRRIVFVGRTARGALLATSIDPGSIDYVTTVVEVPPPEALVQQRIAVPGRDPAERIIKRR